MRTSQSSIMRGMMLGMILPALAPSMAVAQEKPEKPRARQRQSPPEDDRAAWALRTPERAISAFREISGLSDAARPKMTSKLVTLSDDDTPFLHDQIVGRPIWQLVIVDWKLELKSAAADAEDACARTFDIFLDPRDGRLLKILSRWPKGVPPIAPQPPADSAEVQMNSAGLEKYHGFPKEKPRVSFLEALDVVYKDGGLGNPLVASTKQIRAHYVVRSAMGREPKAVWAITLRGFPPFEASYPGVPVDARNHARHIVDAKTGEWICAGTSPQPVETVKPAAEDKKSQQPKARTP